MGRNSSGVYSLPSGNPVTTGTPITSVWANSTLADVAAEITNSLDRSGRGNMLAPLKGFDGTATAPGITFGSETTTGVSRPAGGQMSLSVLAAELQRLTTSGTLFLQPPSYAADPASGNVLARKSYVDTAISTAVAAYAPLAGATFTGTVTAPTFSGALSGNATTATRLATPRAINDVNFDGTANITVADATKMPLTGGTFTGAPIWATAPTLAGHLANKAYVDAAVAGSGAFLPITGGTLTGALGGTTGSFTGGVTAASFVVNGAGKVTALANDGDGAYLESQGANALRLFAGGAMGLRVGSNSYVGIGLTSNAPYPLVVTNGASGPGLEFGPGYSGSDSLIQAYNRATSAYNNMVFSASQYIWGVSGTERMRFDASGNLGIGTTNPTERLVVSSSAVNTYMTVRNTGNSVLVLNSGTAFSAGGAGSMYTTTSVPLVFGTDSAERVRIDALGNVGIGATPQARLQVSSAAAVNGVIGIFRNTGSTGAQLQITQDGVADWSIGQPAGSTGFAFWAGRSGGSAGTEIARFDFAGRLGLGTTIPQELLDVATQTATATTIGIKLGYFSANYGWRLVNESNAASFAAGTLRLQRGTTSSWADVLSFDNSGNGTAGGSFHAGAAVGAGGVSFRIGNATTTDRLRVYPQSGGGGVIMDVTDAGETTTARTLQIGTGGSGTLNLANLGTVNLPSNTPVGPSNFLVGYRDVPRNASGLGRGECFATNAGFTINTGSLGAGFTFSIYNDSAAAITITQGAGVTFRLAGTTTTGNRTIAPRGMATVWCNSGTEAIFAGAGVS